MAAVYVDELRTLQPKGPYYLGGFCFGGLLALEAAQQLRAAGQPVALVVMIQSMHPDARRFRPEASVLERWWYRSTTRIAREREAFVQSRKGYTWERCRHGWQISRARTAIAVDNIVGRRRGSRAGRSLTYLFEALGMAHKWAMDRYVPKPYDGNVLLMRARRQVPGLMADAYLGWQKIVRGRLDVCEVSGFQQTLMREPNVLELARKVDAGLTAAHDDRRHAVGQRRWTSAATA